MKSKILLLTLVCFSLGNTARLEAQISQFVSKFISYQPYDAKTKTYAGEWSPFMDFYAIITFDYDAKEIEVFNSTDGTTFFKAKYKEEMNPDKITGDEQNHYIFDAKSNTLGVKAFKVYLVEGGGYKYILEYKTERAEISGVEDDGDYDGVGDQSQINDQSNLQGGQNIRSLYFKNTTQYDVYVSAKTLPNAFSDWVQSTSWIKIPAGQKVFIGDSAEEYFYFYAYCKDSNGKFLTWEGTEQYNKVGADGPYGFRKLNLSEGTQDDQNNWSLDLYLY